MNLLIIKAIISLLYALLLSFLLLASDNIVVFSIIIFLVLSPVFFLKPKIYFIGFLLIRPIIDLTLRGNTPPGNLSAVLVMPLIFLCCKDIFFNSHNLRAVKSNPFLKKFNIIFGIFLLSALFSFLNTGQIIISLADFLRLVSILVSVNYGVICFSDKLNEFISLILGASIFPCLFGVYQLFFKKGAAELGFNRIYGTFAHPNVFAQFLLLIFFIVWYYLSSIKLKIIRKFFWLLLWMICLSLLVNTFTRHVWIALFVSSIIFVLIRTAFSRKILYASLGASIFLAIFPFISSRFEDITIRTGYKISSWQWRIDLWSRVITNLKEHPIVGYGLGMFQKTIMVMAHNDYLRIAYEMGLLGGIIYLLMLLYILCYSIKKLIASRALFDANRYKTAICLMVSIIIISLADNLVRSTIILMYYFLTIAIFTCANATVMEKNRQK